MMLMRASRTALSSLETIPASGQSPLPKLVV
jgi:hypothetical protein